MQTITIVTKNQTVDYDLPTLGQKVPYHCFLGKKNYPSTFKSDIVVAKGKILYSEEPKPRTVEDIIFRALNHWHIVNIESLSRLTRCSTDRVRDTIRILIRKGFVIDLGRLAGAWANEFRGNLFAIRYKHEKDFAYEGDLISPCGNKFFVSHSPSIHPNYYLTTKGYVVNRHVIGSSDRCSRIVDYLNLWLKKMEMPDGFAFSEHVLRSMFGWYDPDPSKESKAYLNNPKLYRTTIPDAWLVFGEGSFRLEYFRSVPKIEDIKTRLMVMPPGEMMLAVVESPVYDRVNTEQIENILYSFKSEIQSFRLQIIRFFNEMKEPFEAHRKQINGFLNLLSKYVNDRKQLLETPTSCAWDAENINIRELSLHFSQGGFLRLMRKSSSETNKIVDYDGYIISKPCTPLI